MNATFRVCKETSVSTVFYLFINTKIVHCSKYDKYGNDKFIQEEKIIFFHRFDEVIMVFIYMVDIHRLNYSL